MCLNFKVFTMQKKKKKMFGTTFQIIYFKMLKKIIMCLLYVCVF